MGLQAKSSVAVVAILLLQLLAAPSQSLVFDEETTKSSTERHDHAEHTFPVESLIKIESSGGKYGIFEVSVSTSSEAHPISSQPRR